MTNDPHDLCWAPVRCPYCDGHLHDDERGEFVKKGQYLCIGCDAAFDPTDPELVKPVTA